ncbi:hypothetical protein F2Q69_00056225 [Brassica cretica]|uniref:Uncharacterized protein n=1 Tax=Brassica cretica TaxID=69181 RepID=A0A8S9N3U3_BRACR|nr:hypothetical protein F2Q69_00056225 [Brassica cretica]
MWWVVHRRTNKRNLHRGCENKSICDLGKDLDEILKGRLETIEEEPEAEERERLGESQKPMLFKAKMNVEKGKTIVKAKMKSGKVFYMLCIIGLASRRGECVFLSAIYCLFLAWLMINHLLRFPNKTLVPCSIPDKMFVITKSGRSGGLYVNNARIVSPNICRNSRVACHGVSNVITFTEDSFSKAILSPVLSSVRERITSSRH